MAFDEELGPTYKTYFGWKDLGQPGPFHNVDKYPTYGEFICKQELYILCEVIDLLNERIKTLEDKLANRLPL